ncbi:MAG: hypothetical protein ABII00_14995 [Elusimicrobiota bacterium]
MWSRPGPERGSPALALGGLIGGLAGALAGHAAVVAAFRLTGDAGVWLKGPHGPPFFSLLVSTAFFYGGIGAGLFRGRERLAGAALGFGTAFALIYAPLAIGTRVFTWGEGPEAEPTLAWLYLVLGVYCAASAAAAIAIGGRCRGQGSFDGWGGLRALGGVVLGYLLGMGLRRLIPALQPTIPTGWLPPLGATVGGMLSGTCIGAAVAAAPRGPAPIKAARRPSRSPNAPKPSRGDRILEMSREGA